jgi:signal transduction histidine kinase/AraC-like DNA-binding protein/ABC-type branched-subunit amino acid transport system substrate-binding protein
MPFGRLGASAAGLQPAKMRMSDRARIGFLAFPGDAFWLQVEEAIHQRAQGLPVDLIRIPPDDGWGSPSAVGPLVGPEGLLALELDALIAWSWPEELVRHLLGAGLRIVQLTETPVRHPLLTSPVGLYGAARTLAIHLATSMGGRGTMVAIGGGFAGSLHDTGASRLAAVRAVVEGHPDLVLRHIPCSWSEEEAWQQLQAGLLEGQPVDAILGLSDSLALAARDIGRSLGLVSDQTLIGGIDGDPAALAAIAKREMTATVALFPGEIGVQAVELALQAAQRKPLPRNFRVRSTLVTGQNVAGVMAERLTILSRLPGWLVDVTEQRRQRRVDQLEACLEIISRIRSVLDSRRQLDEIADLICTRYGYDEVKIYRWMEEEQRLLLVYPASPASMDVWYDLVGGSSTELLQQAPDSSPAQPGGTRTSDFGSMIIADGLGREGNWYDLTGATSNWIVDQNPAWASAEAMDFAAEFEARTGLKPSPSSAGLAHDYANMFTRIAQQVYRETGRLDRETLADFSRCRLQAGEWSYTGGLIMGEYRYAPETVPDPIVGPRHFIFTVLEYLDGHGMMILPSNSDPAAQSKAKELMMTGPPPAEPPIEVLKVGILGPFSGTNARIGAEIRAAAEMAFEQVDYQIGRYRIEPVWIDSESDPAKAAQAYEDAIVRQGIQAGLLNWFTSVSLSCMQVAAKHKLPHFFAMGGGQDINRVWHSDPDTYHYWVKGWPEPAKLTAYYVQALQDAIAQGIWQPHAKTAALWGDRTDWGLSFATGLKEQLQAAGWEIVAEDYFPPEQTDFVPLLTNIKRLSPALFAGTASNQSAYSSLVSQAAKLGLERVFAWSSECQPSIPLEGAGVLGQTLARGEPLYIPLGYGRVDPPSGSEIVNRGARLVLPICSGETVLGLLDLQCYQPVWPTRLELVGLQALANQLGVAMLEARLYGRAVKARDLAVKSEQSKTRLLAQVSHELRTPLNVILGYIGRALDSFSSFETDVPGALVTDLQSIHQTADHLLRVTNDLLDLSRAQDHELELLPEIVDPRALLIDAFHSIADVVSSETTVWELELPERLPLIRADPVRLRQILLNLLGNAQRFTDEGRITLGAEVAPQHLHIWVQDTGLGIPIDYQGRVFDPFVTAKQPGRRREGVGLGLSIARQLVALHHGSITLESQPGKGSTFHVYLPLPNLLEEPAVFPESAERVLLLLSPDDRPAPELVRYCQRQGLAIHHLQTADSVDEVLAEVRPAALAWDSTHLNGGLEDLLERLRSYPALCQIPFIVYGDRPPDESAPRPGITSFFVKPVDARTLLPAIGAMCSPGPEGTILVVEDDPQARRYYADLAAQECPGHQVRTAEDGVAALALMAQTPPQLVILDLMMPKLDGFEVLERMRADPKISRVPVLVMTGHLLSMEDVKRIEKHALVTLHSKGLLHHDEVAAAIHRSLFGTDALPPQTGALVKRAVAYLQQNYATALTRPEVARALGVSDSYLGQVFRQELGLSPWEYLSRYRIRQAERLLLTTADSITSIALSVGFQDPAYFARVFRKWTGTSPSAFRAS